MNSNFHMNVKSADAQKKQLIHLCKFLILSIVPKVFSDNTTSEVLNKWQTAPYLIYRAMET